MSLIIPRRRLLAGAGAALVARPALVRAHSLLGYGAGGGGPVWTLKAHNLTTGQAVSTVTTPALNMSGADLIIACACTYVADSSWVVSDSTSSNTWTGPVAGISDSNAGGSTLRTWYVQAPTVTGSQTFTYTQAGSMFGCFIVAGFSGSIASPLDTASHAQSLTPGSITPSFVNELVWTAMCAQGVVGGGTVTGVTGGFTIIENNPNVNVAAAAFGWLQQTTAVASNPTWSVDSGFGVSTNFVSVDACFRSV